MLQQTRIEAVKKYYDRFMKRIPDIHTLATIPEDELLKLWEGLGYYSRARNLKKAAQTIEEKYAGTFPNTYEEIITLSGIGEYTASAIASICFVKRHLAWMAMSCESYPVFVTIKEISMMRRLKKS